ncbi:hypothetical protein BY996DRAFT_6570587 [Phakopsora pachyrhizi]|nr:hypothetical protein BY996DRAFT_6570587 [Phakopsora pachyrhizi]
MPPISIIKILIEKEIKFMKMLDCGCATKNPKVEKASRPWDIIRTFGIKASRITSSNKTEKIIDTIADNFNNTSQLKAQQHGKPEQEETSMASDIGPKAYIMKDLPGYRLMVEDFGLILPSITADKRLLKMKLANGFNLMDGCQELGHNQDFQIEVWETWINLGNLSKNDSNWGENLEEKEESQSAPKKPNSGEEEKEVQQQGSQNEKKILETNYKMNKNQEEAKIKEVGGGALENQYQAKKKIIEE